MTDTRDQLQAHLDQLVVEFDPGAALDERRLAARAIESIAVAVSCLPPAEPDTAPLVPDPDALAADVWKLATAEGAPAQVADAVAESVKAYVSNEGVRRAGLP